MPHVQYQKIISWVLATSLGFIPLAACSKEKPYSQKDRFSYTLTFDPNGVPEVKDAKGNTIQAKKVELPLKATKIVRVRTASIMDVEGSHYILIDIGGTLYQINLPD